MLDLRFIKKGKVQASGVLSSQKRVMQGKVAVISHSEPVTTFSEVDLSESNVVARQSGKLFTNQNADMAKRQSVYQQNDAVEIKTLSILKRKSYYLR